MPIFTEPLPLSLYVHIPWCVRKCPYCDFNSHEAKQTIPEKEYIAALLQELDVYNAFIQNRALVSIFFGGGTPSLFSAQGIGEILEGIGKRCSLASSIEVTLEANPGTIDQARFHDLRLIGINRLSLGIQSLQNEKLKTLGRIHDREQAIRSIHAAAEAGFSNFNLDLMHGLPNQSIEDALEDLKTALSFQPTHLSWYQLTIEPNTVFYKDQPVLPAEDTLWEIQTEGQALLHHAGFKQYEVSAFSLPDKTCLHNRNYWEFGDYLGIGAGAYSKITDLSSQTVLRFSQVKQPLIYLDINKRKSNQTYAVLENDLIFEFMLNALRLSDGFDYTLFTERTGLTIDQIEPTLYLAKKRGLLLASPTAIIPSELGKRFLNDLVTLFLPDKRFA